MDQKEILERVIYPSLDQVAEFLPNPAVVKKRGDTQVLGPTSVLDSVSVFSFISYVANNLTQEYQKSLNMADIFRATEVQTAAELADFICHYEA